MRESKRTDIGLLILRIGLGLVMVFYGSQKLFGVFGGAGYTGTIENMRDLWGIHPVFANLAMAAEFLGGLGLLFGLITPVAAFGVLCVMAMATYINLTSPGLVDGIFAGTRPQDVPRIGFPLLIMLGALTILFTGAGKFSLDRKLFRTGR